MPRVTVTLNWYCAGWMVLFIPPSIADPTLAVQRPELALLAPRCSEQKSPFSGLFRLTLRRNSVHFQVFAVPMIRESAVNANNALVIGIVICNKLLSASRAIRGQIVYARHVLAEFLAGHLIILLLVADNTSIQHRSGDVKLP